jgi:hypothetical protein
MIPRFPFRRDNFVADDYLLFFFPSAFNFDYFHTALPLRFTCYDHANLLPGCDASIKKARKEVV